jgi:transcriptional regulator with XRE-family HTH domain
MKTHRTAAMAPERLIQQRLHMSATTLAMANALGISPTHYARLEHGQTPISRCVALAVALLVAHHDGRIVPKKFEKMA